MPSVRTSAKASVSWVFFSDLQVRNVALKHHLVSFIVLYTWPWEGLPDVILCKHKYQADMWASRIFKFYPGTARDFWFASLCGLEIVAMAGQIKHLLIRQKTNRFQFYVSQLCNICFHTGLPQKIHLLMTVAAEFQGGKPPFAFR